MDALSDILKLVRLRGGIFLHCEFSAPWCLHDKLDPQAVGIPATNRDHLVHYHYVLEGSVRSRVRGGLEHRFVAGDALMLPRNDSHFLGSNLDLAPGQLDAVHLNRAGGPAVLKFGGGGETCTLICGYLASDRLDGNPLFAALPPILALRAKDSSGADWIRSTFEYASKEISSGRAGSSTIVAKLSELLFVEAVQRYIDSLPEEQSGWLAGLRDPHIARALALLHGHLDRPWTVERLGEEVGLSRSTLAERFTRIMGEAPIEYLTRWRMHAAAHMLKTTTTPISQVAALVGYESNATLSRSFKKTFGVPPGMWRRTGE